MTILSNNEGNSLALITYLSRHFLTQEELLGAAKVTEQELVSYQSEGLMPKPSYKLTLSLNSDSYFGLHSDTQEVDYYAKGYPSWLALIKLLETKERVFAIFSRRYIDTMQSINDKMVIKKESKNKDELSRHIENEWQHFLSGTYGLCTQSGLPEDIAAKDIAIGEIEAISTMSELDEEQMSRLTAAVNLLDEASALFAPHERSRSSRERLINQVRREYRLEKRPCP